MKAYIGVFVALSLTLGAFGLKAPATKPLGVPIPALEPGQKPNFLVIVTDDQGWDDIGRNNPKYVNTPNMDRFIQDGTFFDNFYVTPQCAQSRAAMLTGRYAARVGTMLVNGAWDFINSNEVTAGKLLAAENYSTAQFGKWHNSEVQGYEPWSPMVGFQAAEIPVSNDGTSNMRLMRTNGSYARANGDVERALLDKMTRYLDKRDEGSKPFYIYCASLSIHMLYQKINGKRQGNQLRFSPPEYRNKYHSNPRLRNLTHLANSTIDAWAALEYLDDVLGSVFDYLKETGLDKSTYVMVMSDNGAAILQDEHASVSKRMPSGMKGDKSTIWEGGIRNFLAVRGPGVQAGAVNSTLLHMIDILPTVTDLAGARSDAAGHLPFDGISFKNLLLPGSGNNTTQLAKARKVPTAQPAKPSSNNTKQPVARPDSTPGVTAGPAMPAGGRHRTVGRGGRPPVIAQSDSLTSKEQYDRFLFFTGPHCWDADAVPLLGPDRKVLRPQPLFDFKTGGMINVINGRELPAALRKPRPGFEICTAVRHREYKWVGLTKAVYRLDGSHKEQRQTEVAEPLATSLRNTMRGAAEKWWQSVVMSPYSLQKPTFYLGLGDRLVSNVLVAGAHERTPGHIRLIPNGAAGFKVPGDRACFKVQVMSPGTYDVIMFYTSSAAATLKLSVGTYGAIQSGAADSITTTLPAQSRMRGLSVGAMTDLPPTGDEPTEACLVLVKNARPGTAVFSHLANIRFTKRQPWQKTAAASGVSRHGFGAAVDCDPISSNSSKGSRDAAAPLAVLAPGLDMLHPNNSWLHGVAVPAAGFGVAPGQWQALRASHDQWQALRASHEWPDGQGPVFESMYSPYHTEDIAECSICQPEV